MQENRTTEIEPVLKAKLALLAFARAAFDAFENSKEDATNLPGVHQIDEAYMGEVNRCLDLLGALPYDHPEFSPSPVGRAERLLRNVGFEPVASPLSDETVSIVCDWYCLKVSPEGGYVFTHKAMRNLMEAVIRESSKPTFQPEAVPHYHANGVRYTEQEIKEVRLQPLDSRILGFGNLPPKDEDKPNTEQGLYEKFRVTRRDYSDGPEGKHPDCDYFVLDLTHDPYAMDAILAYAVACEKTHPVLSADIIKRARGIKPHTHKEN